MGAVLVTYHMSNKYILNFTPTGMIPTKDMSTEVPILPDEIVLQTLEASELGANMVHLHARDLLSGLPTYKKDIYAEIISGIRKQDKEIIICVSTSGRGFKEFEKRSEVLELKNELKPDFGSLTLSSLNFNTVASINSPDMIKALVNKMRANDIRPELEVFDIGMINYANYLIRKDMLKKPFYFNLILGNIACAQANMLNMGLMINDLPEGSVWSAGGIGVHQLNMNTMSLIGGGGVRVGLEDNIWFDPERNHHATNKSLIQRIVQIGNALGKIPFSKKEARDLLNL